MISQFLREQSLLIFSSFFFLRLPTNILFSFLNFPVVIIFLASRLNFSNLVNGPFFTMIHFSEIPRFLFFLGLSGKTAHQTDNGEDLLNAYCVNRNVGVRYRHTYGPVGREDINT